MIRGRSVVCRLRTMGSRRRKNVSIPCQNTESSFTFFLLLYRICMYQVIQRHFERCFLPFSISRHRKEKKTTMPRCRYGELLSQSVQFLFACPFLVYSYLPYGECVFQNGQANDRWECQYRRKGEIVVFWYSAAAQRYRWTIFLGGQLQ
jgi:hypothetical protein